MKIPELNKLLLCKDRPAGCLKLPCVVLYCWFCNSRRWLHGFLLPLPRISLLSVLVSASSLLSSPACHQKTHTFL